MQPPELLDDYVTVIGPALRTALTATAIRHRSLDARLLLARAARWTAARMRRRRGHGACSRIRRRGTPSSFRRMSVGGADSSAPITDPQRRARREVAVLQCLPDICAKSPRRRIL